MPPPRSTLPARHRPSQIDSTGFGRDASLDQEPFDRTLLTDAIRRAIQDPNEMDLSLSEASARVGLPIEEVSRSLASFVRSVVSGNSPFDRFVDGDRSALTRDQQDGLQLFRGKANCTACHIGPTFSDERFHNTGATWRGGRLVDEGRFGVTGRTEDHGAFKTPTLREIARTAPYMHDGSLATLSEVLDYYDRGGNAAPGLDPELRPLRLSEDEKRSLVAFLESLNGST